MNRTIRNGARRLPQWTTRNKSSLRPAAQSWAALTPLNSVHAVSAPLDSRQRPSNTTLFGNNSGMDNTHSSPSNRNSIASSSGGTSEVRRRSSSGALSFLAQKSSPRRQFTNLEERDSYYTSAIAACGRNWRRAVLLMNEFEREASSGQYSGKPLPASVYGATMHVCAQGGEWALTLELLDSMGKVPPSSSSDGASLMSRPLPNVRCYEEALLACSLSRQANAALALIETMRTGTHHRQSGAVSLNDPTAGAVTDSAGAAKSSDGGAAAAAAADVAFKPSDRCLNLAMTACTRAGQSNDALKLFDTFQSQRLVEPNEFIYGAAAAACRAGGHWQRAIKLLDQMEASVVAGQDSSGVAAVAPNEVIYTAVIAACGAAKQWVAALEVFERMQRVGKLKPNVVTYASVSFVVWLVVSSCSCRIIDFYTHVTSTMLTCCCGGFGFYSAGHFRMRRSGTVATRTASSASHAGTVLKLRRAFAHTHAHSHKRLPLLRVILSSRYALSHMYALTSTPGGAERVVLQRRHHRLRESGAVAVLPQALGRDGATRGKRAG